jgi:hypothetical protein
MVSYCYIVVERVQDSNLSATLLGLAPLEPPLNGFLEF